MFDNKYGSPFHIFVSRLSSDIKIYFSVSLMNVENSGVRVNLFHTHIHAFIVHIRNVECWRLENIVVVGEALCRELETE